jgi:hypothetical protein
MLYEFLAVIVSNDTRSGPPWCRATLSHWHSCWHNRSSLVAEGGCGDKDAAAPLALGRATRRESGSLTRRYLTLSNRPDIRLSFVRPAWPFKHPKRHASRTGIERVDNDLQ